MWQFFLPTAVSNAIFPVWNFATVRFQHPKKQLPNLWNVSVTHQLMRVPRFVHQPANLWDVSVTHQLIRVLRSVHQPANVLGVMRVPGFCINFTFFPNRFKMFLSRTWLGRSLTLAGSNLSTHGCQYCDIASDHDIYIYMHQQVYKMKIYVPTNTHTHIFIYIYM